MINRTKREEPPAAGTTGGSFHNSIIIIFSQNGINGRLIQAQKRGEDDEVMKNSEKIV